MANAMYRVAVLMATYNSENFLLQQLTSIFSQKDVSIELFVYDDFSTDSTNNILSELSQSYPINIAPSVLRFGSASGSFFYLLQSCKDQVQDFDFVALADHDDVWFSHKLIEAINLMKVTNASCYSSSATSLNYSPHTGIRRSSGGGKSGCMRDLDFIFEGPGPGCTFVFKKDFSVRLSEFLIGHRNHLNGVFWHDWFIYCYARINKYKWIIDERSFIIYIQHGKNETGVNSGYSAKVRRIRAIFNGFYLNQARTNLAIVAPHTLEYKRILRFKFSDRVWFLFRILSMRRRVFDAITLLTLLILNPFANINPQNKSGKF